MPCSVHRRVNSVDERFRPFLPVIVLVRAQARAREQEQEQALGREQARVQELPQGLPQERELPQKLLREPPLELEPLLAQGRVQARRQGLVRVQVLGREQALV